jgi:hypothetical protein
MDKIWRNFQDRARDKLLEINDGRTNPKSQYDDPDGRDEPSRNTGKSQRNESRTHP